MTRLKDCDSSFEVKNLAVENYNHNDQQFNRHDF